ncbi:MAG: tRNA (N6-threonylcarbamoyladenosine(37)-N6)-methyltransferase TrmO [Desulfosudaceae bacterium]
MSDDNYLTMTPIGYVYTEAEDIPRHWTLSDVTGRIVIKPAYVDGLADITSGQDMVVLFCFHKSPAFEASLLRQKPPHRQRPLGVFSICSPRRPNPIGLSVVRVLDIKDGEITVQGIDMLDGTPVLDIKPHIIDRETCPS